MATILTEDYNLRSWMSTAFMYGDFDDFTEDDHKEYNQVCEVLKERHTNFSLTEVSEDSWFGYPELGNRNMSGDIATFTFIVDKL